MPGAAHLVDEAAGAGVADVEAALDQRDAAAAGFDHDVHGVVVERVFFLAFGEALGGAELHELGVELRLGDFLEELADVFDFLVVDEGALGAAEAGAGGLEHEHVALAEEQFAAGLVEHDARIEAGADLEADAAGHVGFDQAGDDLGFGALGGEDEVDADGAGLLGDADDVPFDFLARSSSGRRVRR